MRQRAGSNATAQSSRRRKRSRPATVPADTLEAVKQRAAEEVERRKEQLVALSHAIHENPELSWEEHAAAALVADALRDAGFAVEVGAYDVPTSVEAVYGDGDLTVTVCAE